MYSCKNSKFILKIVTFKTSILRIFVVCVFVLHFTVWMLHFTVWMLHFTHK